MGSLRSRSIRGGVAPPSPPPLGVLWACRVVMSARWCLSWGTSQRLPAGLFPPPAPLRGVCLAPQDIFFRLGLNTAFHFAYSPRARFAGVMMRHAAYSPRARRFVGDLRHAAYSPMARFAGGEYSHVARSAYGYARWWLILSRHSLRLWLALLVTCLLVLRTRSAPGGAFFCLSTGCWYLES